MSYTADEMSVIIHRARYSQQMGDMLQSAQQEGVLWAGAVSSPKAGYYTVELFVQKA